MDKSQVRSTINETFPIGYDSTTGNVFIDTTGANPNDVLTYASGTVGWQPGGGGGGGSSWELLGNAGTDPATEFLGTTDNKDFALRTNNVERLRVYSGGRVSINTSSAFQYLNVSGGTYFSGNNGTSHLLEIIGANDNLVNVDGTGVVIGATDSTNYSEIYAQADGLLHFGSNKPMEFIGQVKIVDGTQGSGKLFISDSNGVGSWQSSGTVLAGFVPYTGAIGDVNLGANTLISALLKANGSGGLGIQGSGGSNSILVGAGGGQNSTFYGGAKLDYATANTLPVLDVSKNLVSSAGTGFVKVTAGVVSYDNTTYGTGTVTSIATAGLISGGTITGSGTITTAMATNKLVGRATAGTGVMEEITLGTNLSLSGTTLNAGLPISTQVASGSSVIEFTGLSNAYNNYRIDINDFLASTAGATFQIRVGTGGTPTWQTGTSYEWRRGYYATSVATNNSIADDKIVVSGAIGTTTSQAVNGFIRVYAPSQASNWHMIYTEIQFKTNTSEQVILYSCGWYAATTAVTAIRLYMSTGNLAAGTFRLYGE
jgi:hypothetical protein